MKLRFDKVMFAKVEMWVLALLGFLGLFALMFFAWFLRHAPEEPNASL